MGKLKDFAILIQNETGKTLIRANQGNRIPEYPFITYQSIGEEQDNVYELEESLDGDIATNKYYNRVEDVVQFDFYAETEEQAKIEAKELIKWLMFQGRQVIKDNGYGIIEIGSIVDNTRLEQTKVFYRKTLDVTIDYLEESSYEIENAQRVVVTNKVDDSEEIIERS